MGGYTLVIHTHTHTHTHMPEWTVREGDSGGEMPLVSTKNRSSEAGHKGTTGSPPSHTSTHTHTHTLRHTHTHTDAHTHTHTGTQTHTHIPFPESLQCASLDPFLSGR